jgi:hypothetical protein
MAKIGSEGDPYSPQERLIWVIGGEFGKKEQEALLKDGALIYQLNEHSMFEQYELGAPLDETWYEYEGMSKIARLSPRRIQIALYPDPKNFYIPDSEAKTLAEQEMLAQQESILLRQRLGVDGIEIPVPKEPAILTEAIWKHKENTGEWLLGKEYGYKTIRTTQRFPEIRVDVINGGVMSLGPSLFTATVRIFRMEPPMIHVGAFMHESSASNVAAARWIFPRTQISPTPQSPLAR